MKVIRLSGEHVEDWINMRSELWPDCPPEDHKKETAEALLLANTMPVWLAVAENNLPVGFIEVSTRRDEEGFKSENVPYIEGWFVKGNYRRLGVGRLLVKTVLEWATHEVGINEVGSDAATDNHASIFAHQHLGFSILKKDSVEVKFRWVRPSLPETNQ